MLGGGGTEPRGASVEMSADTRFAWRIIRLAITSAIVLGVILMLAEVTLHPSRGIEIGLGGGWLLMPTVLALSLRWPRVRYALVVPSALVSLSLLAICLTWPIRDSWARIGWFLLTVGVLFGGVLGGWLWFRWLPVPRGLNEPFSPARWTLIGVHTALIVVGIGLVLARAAR